MSIPDPIVLLDARAKYLHPDMRVSRNTIMTGYDVDGLRKSYQPNSAVWEYRPNTGQRAIRTALFSENLLLHSNDFTQQEWVSGSVDLTPNAATGADGEASLTRMEQLTNPSGWRAMYQVVSVSSYPITISADLKADTSNYAGLRAHGALARAGVAFDLLTGDVVRVDEESGGTVSRYGCIYLGNGIWRCWVTVNLESTDTAPEIRVHLTRNTGSISVTEPVGVLVGAVQAEERHALTPYIETAGSTAQRNSTQLILGLGDKPWWRRDNGTIVLDAQQPWPASFSRFIDFGNPMYVAYGGGSGGFSEIRFTSDDVGVSNRTLVRGAATTDRHIFALSWDGDGIAVAVDGSVVVQEDRVDTGAISSVGLLSRINNPFGVVNGYGHRAVYYPARLSNAQLQSLTAIQE